MQGLSEREAPRWLIIGAAVVLFLTIAYFGAGAISGRAPDPGPPKKVFPGMYDLRAEAAKMRASQQNGALQNGR